MTTETINVLEQQLRENQLKMDIRLQEAQIKSIDRALSLDASRRSFGSAGDQEVMEGLYAPEDYIDVMDYRRDNYGYQAYAATFTTKTDRQDGRNWPYWVSEPELAAIRGTVRLLATYNKTCIGVLNKLRNYTVCTGFTRKVVSKRDAPQELVDAIATILDEFDELHKITGNLDQECLIRDVRDGEIGLGLWHQGDGYVDLRVVEPDQISEPTNKHDLEEWLQTADQLDGQECSKGGCLPFESNWSFGVHTTKSDVCSKHGYYVQWDGDLTHWDYMPGGNKPCYPPSTGFNTWLEFTKRGTDRNIKRGVGDFWPITGDVELARKIIRNLTHAGALQAAIAWIREMVPGTTAQQVNSATMATADWQTRTATQNGGTRTSYQQTYQPGSTLYLGANQKFVPPPWMQQSMSGALVGVFEAMLRSVSQIWSMPEHMVTGSAANNNYACHDDHTELLTKRGWLHYNQIRYGDMVGTMNPRTHRFEWQELQAIHIFDHEGDMVRLRSKHNFDVMVTPNHRMFITSEEYAGRELLRQGRFRAYQFVTADKVKVGDYLPTSCKPKNGIPVEMFEVPAVSYKRCNFNKVPVYKSVSMEPFLSYVGWWIAEGWLIEYNNTYTASLSQKASSEAKCNSIDDAVSALPFGHRDRVSDGMRVWEVYGKSLLKWLEHNCGKGSYNKRLPDFVHDLPAVQQKMLLKALVGGDGTLHPSGSMHFFTVSRQLADDVQALAIQCGYSSHCEKPMYNGVIPVSIRCVRHKAQLSSHHISRVPYVGKVWCVSVPNGITITRRQGKMAITGNSILEAGSPFVKEIETRQSYHINLWLAVYWKVIYFNWRAGRIGRGYAWKDIKRAVDIKLTGPQIDVRDRMKDTQQNIMLVDAGIMSPTECASREGLDYDEQVEQGAKKAAPPGPGGAGGPALEGPTQQPSYDEAQEAWTDEARERSAESRRAQAKVTPSHIKQAAGLLVPRSNAIGYTGQSVRDFHASLLKPLEEELQARGYSTSLNHSNTSNSSYLTVLRPGNTPSGLKVVGEIRISDHRKPGFTGNYTRKNPISGSIHHSVLHSSAKQMSDRLDKVLDTFPSLEKTPSQFESISPSVGIDWSKLYP